MRALFPIVLCGLTALATLRAEPAPPTPAWTHVNLAPAKTSIYFGSVTITTTPFACTGSTFAGTYVAKVFPWAFWGESGRISITLPADDLVKLSQCQTVEFKGEAANQKGKPRKVAGKIQPADSTSGKIKVRVSADGVELIFNTTFQVSP